MSNDKKYFIVNSSRYSNNWVYKLWVKGREAMTNGLKVGDYVTLNIGGNFAKIIGIEDHEKHYSDLHLAVIMDGEVIQLKQRADHVRLTERIPTAQAAILDNFVPMGKYRGEMKITPDMVSGITLPEDYPGHNHEIAIQDAIRKAVNSADRIIVTASDGSTEETDYMTFKLAEAFLAKIGNRLAGQYLAQKLGLRPKQAGKRVQD